MTISTRIVNLKWNEFHQTITSSYQELRKGSDFSDVTLVCEDNQHIEAHRIILTAFSTFFSTLLKSNTHSHPMVYMRGIKTKDMAAIIDFIYHGEANIFQEDLAGFLALAEELQLKGMTGLKPIQEMPEEAQPYTVTTEKQEHHEVSISEKNVNNSTDPLGGNTTFEAVANNVVIAADRNYFRLMMNRFKVRENSKNKVHQKDQSRKQNHLDAGNVKRCRDYRKKKNMKLTDHLEELEMMSAKNVELKETERMMSERLDQARAAYLRLVRAGEALKGKESLS